MNAIEEKVFFRTISLYNEKRQPSDPAPDKEMGRGIRAWIQKERIGEHFAAASEKPALFSYLFENEMLIFRDMSGKIMYNYFYKLEEKMALSDISRQIFYLAQQGGTLGAEQAREWEQRLYGAAAGLLGDPECSEFAEWEVSESLLDLSWLKGDREAVSVRMGRLRP